MYNKNKVWKNLTTLFIVLLFMGILPYDSTGSDAVLFGPAFNYTISFIESGLPPVTNWSVSLSGNIHTASGDKITFKVPKGLYSYLIPPDVGYDPDPSLGSINVNGSNITELVSFEYGSCSPYAIALDPLNNRLFVTDYTLDEVTIINATNNNVIGNIQVG